MAVPRNKLIVYNLDQFWVLVSIMTASVIRKEFHVAILLLFIDFSGHLICNIKVRLPRDYLFSPGSFHIFKSFHKSPSKISSENFRYSIRVPKYPHPLPFLLGSFLHLCCLNASYESLRIYIDIIRVVQLISVSFSFLRIRVFYKLLLSVII